MEEDLDLDAQSLGLLRQGDTQLLAWVHLWKETTLISH